MKAVSKKDFYTVLISGDNERLEFVNQNDFGIPLESWQSVSDRIQEYQKAGIISDIPYQYLSPETFRQIKRKESDEPTIDEIKHHYVFEARQVLPPEVWTEQDALERQARETKQTGQHKPEVQIYRAIKWAATQSDNLHNKLYFSHSSEERRKLQSDIATLEKNFYDNVDEFVRISNDLNLIPDEITRSECIEAFREDPGEFAERYTEHKIRLIETIAAQAQQAKQAQQVQQGKPLSAAEALIAEHTVEGRKYYDVSEKLAADAMHMNSFSDYVPGSVTADYRQAVNEVYNLAEKSIKEQGLTDENAERITGLADLYSKSLAEWYDKQNANEARVPSVMISGAGNFPVRAKEKQNARRDTLWQEYDDIKKIKSKISNISNSNAIRSDDKDALEKLEQKLEGLKSSQELMVAVNAYYRKNKTLDGMTELSAETKKTIEEDMSQSWHGAAKPFATYSLTNSNAEIHRIQGRIDEIKRNRLSAEKAASGEKTYETAGKFEVKENIDVGRLQLIFPDKPDEATRGILKSNGFVWAPSQSAWQRHLNDNGRYALRRVMGALGIPEQVKENTKEKDFTTQYEEYKQRFHDDSRVDYTPIAIDEVNRVILHEQKDRRGGWEQTSYVVTRLSNGAGDPNTNYSTVGAYEALNAFETYNQMSSEPYTDMESLFGQLVHLQRTERDFYSEFIPVNPISLKNIKSEISLRQLRLENNNVTAAVRNIAFEYNLPILSYPDAKQDFERFLNEAVSKVSPEKAKEFLARQLKRAENCLEKNKIDTKTQTLPAAWYNATIETIEKLKRQEESAAVQGGQAQQVEQVQQVQQVEQVKQVEQANVSAKEDIAVERAEKRVQLTEEVAELSAKLENVFKETGLDTEAETMAKIPKNQEKVAEEWNQDYYKAKNEKRLTEIEKNVPEEMKALPHWCAFKTYKDKKTGDLKKVIINCQDGLWASSIDPNTWTNFDSALDYARANNCMGLTFALKDSGISCVDLDKCIDENGKRSQTAWDVLNRSGGSYAEKSVSSRGIHVFVKGGIGSEYKNRNEGIGLEAYDNHFMSITGNLVSKTNALKECPDKLKTYLQEKLGKKTVEREWTPGVSSASDSAVIERIRRSKKRGDTFDRLYRGDISGYPTHSDADMDMCNILAFFTDCDPHQMESIFCSSGLYRDKKDAYLEHTINKAITTLYKRPDKIGTGSGNAGCNGK